MKLPLASNENTIVERHLAPVFGIRNNPNDWVAAATDDIPLINRYLYSNILKSTIQEIMPNLRNGTAMYIPFKSAPITNWHNPDLSLPLLLEHKNDLSHLWKNFKERSIITNRRTLRSFIKSSPKTFALQLSVKKLIVDGQEKIFYILNFAPRQYSAPNDWVSPIIVDKLNSVEYTDYICKELTFKKTGAKVYYSCEIDAFDPINKVPIEIKSFHKPNKTFEMNPQRAYSAALQCHLAGIKDILVAFHSKEENLMQLKYFTLDDLKKRANNIGYNFDKTIAEINYSLFNIFEYADAGCESLCGKIIDITKEEFSKKLIFKIRE